MEHYVKMSLLSFVFTLRCVGKFDIARDWLYLWRYLCDIIVKFYSELFLIDISILV